MTSETENNVTLRWLVAERVLLVDMSQGAPEDVGVRYDDVIVAHLDSTPHIVDVVLHMPPRDPRKPPSLRTLTSYKYQQHPRLGYVLLVGMAVNPLIRFLISASSSLIGMKSRSYETMADAEVFLKTRHPGLSRINEMESQ